MELTKENFGDCIRKIRKEKNMSRRELGKILNLSHRTIEWWELGRSPARGLIEFYNFMNKK